MKKTSLPFKIILTLICVLNFALSTNKIFAQTTPNEDAAISIVAIPPKKGDESEMLRLYPGEKLQTTIRIRNTSEKTLTLESLVKDFIVGEDGFTPVAVSDDVSNRWSLADWMTIIPNVNTLAPGEMAQINVLIEAPADALPGGHYAMVLHQPNSGDTNTTGNDSASSINQQVGTLFYVVVEGDIKEQAFVQNFTFQNFSEFGPIPYSYHVENQSDIHINAKTKIDIYNMLGVKVGTIIPDARNVFPMMSRSFEGLWDRKWGFGQYTARLSMAYGEAGQIATASSKFWIMPIRVIVAVLVGILLLIIIITLVKKNNQTKNQLQEEHIKELEEQVKQLEEQNNQQ